MSETLNENSTNGVENEQKTNSPEEIVKETGASSRKSRRLRSRSTTPQLKNGNSVETEKIEAMPEIIPEEDVKEKVENCDNDTKAENGEKETQIDVNETENEKQETNSTEEYMLDSESYMEPLVLQSDEPCSELEFEESDKDSGKYSPIISRCATRRSQNRNIPTPKTPKSLLDDADKDDEGAEFYEIPLTPMKSELNETDNSNMNNLSTNVQVGSEPDYSDGESDFLSTLRNERSRSVIRSRKSIREDIRRKSLKNSMQQRANLSIPFFSFGDSVERAPSVKRKSRSETPEDRKRFKNDSGLVARITSPFSSLRSRWNVPTGTSTPKLTSYRDHSNHLGGDLFDQMPRDHDVPNAGNKWCNIM